MMKYRLKDQELQKKLDGLTKGAFSKWLLEQADINGFGDGTTYGVKLGEAIELGVLVRSEAVEVIHEYDPNDWNVFPDVTPPEGVMMRCIIKTPGRNLDGPEPELPKIYARTSGVWDGRRWQFFGYGSLCEGSTVEYRTWE